MKQLEQLNIYFQKKILKNKMRLDIINKNYRYTINEH